METFSFRYETSSKFSYHIPVGLFLIFAHNESPADLRVNQQAVAIKMHITEG